MKTNKRNTFKLHPLCEMFPRLPKKELEELAEDIKANGQAEDIVLLDGEILDGQNRYFACEIADVEPRTTGYVGSDPLGFVVSKNLKRRHLNESQRALIAAEYATRRKGESNRSTDPFEPKDTIAEAAEKLHVSTGSVKRGRTVKEKGSKGLKNLVRDGGVSIAAAATITKLSKKKQSQLAAKGGDAVREAAAKLQLPPRGGFKNEAKESPPASFADKPPGYVRGAKPPPLAPSGRKVSAEIVDATTAIERVEDCYNFNKEWFNALPQRSPRAIVDRIIEALRSE